MMKISFGSQMVSLTLNICLLTRAKSKYVFAILSKEGDRSRFHRSLGMVGTMENSNKVYSNRSKLVFT